MFVNISKQDFHLQQGSPAIDAGMRLNHRVDFDGNSIPVGTSTDIGAFEFGGAGKK